MVIYVSHLLEVLCRSKENGVLSGEGQGKMNGNCSSSDVSVIPHGDLTLLCTEHGAEMRQFCCTCEELICSLCINGNHSSHDCEPLQSALVRRREESSFLKSTVCDVGSVQCELVSELVGMRSQGFVERSGKTQYQISYQQPTIKGRHQLHIQINGAHVKGSPFSVAVKSPVENLSTSLVLGRAQRPWGVAMTHRGEVVVAEYSGHRISILRPSGHQLLSFGSSGSGPGQFSHPCEVAVDAEGNIIVTDSWNHRIQKFTAKGEFLKAAGSEGNGELQFHCPIGIAFNSINSKLYIGDGNNRIQILNSDLSYCDTFGKEGNGEGQFNTPWGVACDSTGKVYVADSYNHRIQVFTAEGEFLWVIGRRGHGRGELGWPAGVAVDGEGMVLVSEGDNQRVSVFTSEGRFVTSFGRKGEGRGELVAARGIAVDLCGVVCVCDRDLGRIQLF